MLTQFNSHSLHRHINQTYNFDKFHTGFVEILAAEQTLESADWYQGTADALRKQIFQIRSSRAKYVLILAGDHLYRMDYAPMAEFHWEQNADITVAVQPVVREEASRLGILKREQGWANQRFRRKTQRPGCPVQICQPDKQTTTVPGVDGHLSLQHASPDRTFTAITPILMISAVISFPMPSRIVQCMVMISTATGGISERSVPSTRPTWTLTCQNPPFNFFDSERPVYTHSRFLPGSVVEDSQLKDVLLADGCQIQQGGDHPFGHRRAQRDCCRDKNQRQRPDGRGLLPG